MKHYYLFMVMLFTTLFSYSQNIESNEVFRAEMDDMFDRLDKSKIPTGLLKDYALELAKMEDYAGQLSDTNQIYTQNFLDILRTLYSAQIHSTAIEPVDTLQKQLENYPANNEITLAGLGYQYAYIRADALSNGLLSYQNNQAYDKYINGVWQNPYSTAYTVAFTTLDTAYTGLTQTFRLPAAFYKTNLSRSTLQIDAGDGNGFRNITSVNPIQVNYASAGYKTLTFKTIVQGTTLLSHAKILIKEEPIMPMSIDIARSDTLAITSEELLDGHRANGYMTIFYASPDRIIRKPLIVAEGFDPGHIISPDVTHGANEPGTFIDDIQRNGSNLYQYFSNNDYDIIYIDWNNGTDDIRRNAKLLKTAIKMVNQRKQGSAKNVIIGQSMGGLVTRWALKEMENQGIDHQCNIFVSHDVPHLGAHVPIGAQYMANHLLGEYMGTGWIKTSGSFLIELLSKVKPARILALAHTPAARQMLINYINIDGQLDNSYYSQFQSQLRSLGFPQGVASSPLKMIAISNGSACATAPLPSTTNNLLSIEGNVHTRFLGDLAGTIAIPLLGALFNKAQLVPGVILGRNDIDFDVKVNAANNGGGNNVYYSKAVYTKRFLWLLPIRINLWNINKNAPSNVMPIERFAGGQYSLDLLNLKDTSIKNVLIRANIAFEHVNSFTFIPTPSALAIGANSRVLNSEDYTRPYIGAVKYTGNLSSPFSEYITGVSGASEAHISFNNTNGDWLAAQLSGSNNVHLTCPTCNIPSLFGIDGQNYLYDMQQGIYTLKNISGLGVQWSVDNSNYSIIRNGNTATLKKINNNLYTDAITLTATLPTSCRGYSASKRINTFVFPQSLNISVDVYTWGEYAEIFTSIHNLPPNLKGTYKVYVGGQLFVTGNYKSDIFDPGNDYYIGNLQGCQDFEIFVEYTSDDGSIAIGGFTTAQICREQYNYMVSPNPSTTTISIAPVEQTGIATRNMQANTTIPTFDQVVITDITGNIKLRQNVGKTNRLQLNVSSLSNGIYYLNLYSNGKIIEKKTIQIRK